PPAPSLPANPAPRAAPAVPFIVSAPSITLNGPVSASNVTFTTDNYTGNATVSSTNDINFATRSFFRPINLGAATDSGSALDFSAAEINSFLTGSAGVLSIGNASAGQVTIQTSIAPTGTQTLALGSGSGISQVASATITVPKLALAAGNGDISLQEDNTVGTLAALQCCTGRTFTFTEAQGALLTIG